MNPKELYKINVDMPKQGNFIYFEDLYPDIIDLDDFEDVPFIQSKGFEVTRGLINGTSFESSVTCCNCNTIITHDANEIEQYAICPNCGAVLTDIEF